MLFIVLLLSLVGFSQAINEAYIYPSATGTSPGCYGANSSFPVNSSCQLLTATPINLYASLVCDQGFAGAVRIAISTNSDCTSPSYTDGNTSECLTVTFAGSYIANVKVFCDVVDTGASSSSLSSSSASLSSSSDSSSSGSSDTSSSSGVSGSSSSDLSSFSGSSSSSGFSSSLVSSSTVTVSSSSTLPPLTPGKDLHFFLYFGACGSPVVVLNYTANNYQCLPIIQIISPALAVQLGAFAGSSLRVNCNSATNNFTANVYSNQACTVLNSTLTGSLTGCTPLTLGAYQLQFQVQCLGGGSSSSTGTSAASNLAPQFSLIGLLIFALALKYSN